MPRVVPNQKEKFDSDELMLKLRQEFEVTYSSHREKSVSERSDRFFQELFTEKQTTLAVVGSGVVLHLDFSAQISPDSRKHYSSQSTKSIICEPLSNRIYLRARFILNGVCVQWLGWIDRSTLRGSGHLEFDHEAAAVENNKLRNEQYQYLKPSWS